MSSKLDTILNAYGTEKEITTKQAVKELFIELMKDSKSVLPKTPHNPEAIKQGMNFVEKRFRERVKEL